MYVEVRSTIGNAVMTFLVNGLFDSVMSYKTHVGGKS